MTWKVVEWNQSKLDWKSQISCTQTSAEQAIMFSFGPVQKAAHSLNWESSNASWGGIGWESSTVEEKKERISNTKLKYTPEFYVDLSFTPWIPGP